MENIFEYRDHFESEHLDLSEFDCLDVRLFTERSITNEACNQDYICEFLITYGGPTVRLTIDSRWTYGELFHSWGVDHDGNEKKTIEIGAEVTAYFKSFIEEIYNV
tara:strand:- start:398 stop:715 length:318 start_codon:yes stop_codon:yes gene_type:complete